MQLSPEERHKIYEEEKARIDAEQKQLMTTGGSTTGTRRVSYWRISPVDDRPNGATHDRPNGATLMRRFAGLRRVSF